MTNNINMNDLLNFYNDYTYNHLIYLKYYTKNIDLDDDITEYDYDDKPGDQACIVSANIYDNICNKKFIFSHKKIRYFIFNN